MAHKEERISRISTCRSTWTKGWISTRYCKFGRHSRHTSQWMGRYRYRNWSHARTSHRTRIRLRTYWGTNRRSILTNFSRCRNSCWMRSWENIQEWKSTALKYKPHASFVPTRKINPETEIRALIGKTQMMIIYLFLNRSNSFILCGNNVISHLSTISPFPIPFLFYQLLQLKFPQN